MSPALLLLVACRGSTTTTTTTTTATTTTTTTTTPATNPGESAPLPVDPEATVEGRALAFAALADAAGFDVQAGSYGFLQTQDCCAVGGNCYGNNPASPYGYAYLPPAPGQTAADRGEEQFGHHSNFHLRSDEVVVLVGVTPPEVRYFGFRNHLAERWFDGLTPSVVLGTTGLDLTIRAFQEQRGTADVFEQPMALVSAADDAVAAVAADLLVEAGFARSEIAFDRIGADLANFGLAEGDDTFALIQRVAVFADPLAEAAYRADPGLTPFRLTPRAVVALPDPHLADPLPERGSGTDEERWGPSVDALGAALATAFPGFHVASDDEMTSKGVITYDCIDDQIVCGDLSSRIFLRTPTVPLPVDGTFLVAFGVNHQRTGKVLYSSLAVQAFEHNIGLAAVESDAMSGSAAPFVPDDPLVDDLYAVVVARDCAPFPGLTCIEVPTGCPGVSDGGGLYLLSRLYVDQVTSAAPLESELVADRAYLMSPL